MMSAPSSRSLVARSVNAMVLDGLSEATRGFSVVSTPAAVLLGAAAAMTVLRRAAQAGAAAAGRVGGSSSRGQSCSAFAQLNVRASVLQDALPTCLLACAESREPLVDRLVSRPLLRPPRSAS